MLIELKLGKSFTANEAWQEAHKLTLLVYRATKVMYKEAETVPLAERMRLAALDASERVAEGSVHDAFKDKIRAYSGALKDLVRFENILHVVSGLEYVYARDFDEISKQCGKVKKLLELLLGKTRITNKA